MRWNNDYYSKFIVELPYLLPVELFKKSNECTARYFFRIEKLMIEPKWLKTSEKFEQIQGYSTQQSKWFAGRLKNKCVILDIRVTFFTSKSGQLISFTTSTGVSVMLEKKYYSDLKIVFLSIVAFIDLSTDYSDEARLRKVHIICRSLANYLALKP